MSSTDTADKGKPAPRPSEAEMMLYRCLVTANPPREKRLLTVRHLLREASRNLERRR
jgi:hypothetical protein